MARQHKELNLMTFAEITHRYSWGSPGFIEALETHQGGFQITRTEAARLCIHSTTPAEFTEQWQDTTWWTDEANP